MGENESSKPTLSVWSLIARIGTLSGHLMCFVTIIVVFLFIGPKMEAYFTEMLAGEPLPALTRWVLTFRMIPVFISFLIVMLSATILALGAHVPKPVAWLNTLALIFHCLIIGAAILGYYMPTLKMTEQIGGL